MMGCILEHTRNLFSNVQCSVDVSPYPPLVSMANETLGKGMGWSLPSPMSSIMFLIKLDWQATFFDTVTLCPSLLSKVSMIEKFVKKVRPQDYSRFL